MERQSHAVELDAQLAMILGFLVLSRLEESIALLVEVVIHKVLGCQSVEHGTKVMPGR